MISIRKPVLLFAVLALTCPAAWACYAHPNSYFYNYQRLAERSDAVFDGKVLKKKIPKGYSHPHYFTVRVTHVEKGDIKPGSIVTVWHPAEFKDLYGPESVVLNLLSELAVYYSQRLKGGTIYRFYAKRDTTRNAYELASSRDVFPTDWAWIFENYLNVDIGCLMNALEKSPSRFSFGNEDIDRYSKDIVKRFLANSDEAAEKRLREMMASRKTPNYCQYTKLKDILDELPRKRALVLEKCDPSLRPKSRSR